MEQELALPAPRFSVVVPAFNEQACIAACLRALAAQDFDGTVEWLVVDNASTDATAEIARRHGARVVFEHRPGVICAREAGRRAARGEIVVTTDADTVVPPGWLSAIDRAWRENPDAALVGGPCRYVDCPRWGAWADRLIFGTVDGVRRLTGRVIYVTATNLSYRRAQFPGYQTRFTQGADEIGVLTVLRGQGTVVWLPDNPCFTSGRRLRGGLVRTALVELGYRYLLTYHLNRIAGRCLLGPAPPIRVDVRTADTRLLAALPRSRAGDRLLQAAGRANPLRAIGARKDAA